MRKVYAVLKIRLIINAEDEVDIYDVLDNMDYNFTADTEGSEIYDMEILDYVITDSK